MPAVRLLHVFSTLAIGGPQRRFAQIANALGRKYHHLLIAMDSDYAALSLLAPEVPFETIDLMAGRRKSAGNIPAFRRALADLKPEALITYNWGAIEWAMANRFRPISRHIHIEDGFGPEEVHRQIWRRVVFRRLALGGSHTTVVLPSLTLYKIATDRWKLPATKLVLVPNGVDVERFAGADRAVAAKRIGKRIGERLIGTVARLRPEKNVGRLVEAFAGLAARRPDCRLLIVGDGPQREAIETIARDRGVAARTIFVGPTPAPEDYLAAMDVFAVSSDTEQMPLGVLEAMAAGLPVASVDVGDIAQMVDLSNRPFIVAAGDASALGQAIEALIAEPGLGQRVGAANLDRARSVYTLQAMTSIYDQIYAGGPS